jgi:hypothetical protein
MIGSLRGPGGSGGPCLVTSLRRRSPRRAATAPAAYTETVIEEDIERGAMGGKTSPCPGGI